MTLLKTNCYCYTNHHKLSTNDIEQDQEALVNISLHTTNMNYEKCLNIRTLSVDFQVSFIYVKRKSTKSALKTDTFTFQIPKNLVLVCFIVLTNYFGK